MGDLPPESAIEHFDAALTAAKGWLDKPVQDLGPERLQVASIERSASALKRQLAGEMNYAAPRVGIRGVHAAMTLQVAEILAQEARLVGKLSRRLLWRRIIAMVLVLLRILPALAAVILVFVYRHEILAMGQGLVNAVTSAGGGGP